MATQLPPESLNWDARERNLWSQTNGRFHPQRTTGRVLPMPGNGIHKAGSGGREGRVSILTPTTEERHGFHPNLWACFQAQLWPDKELVVVETFHYHHSSFLAQQALKDNRLCYATFQLPFGEDWSIGLKRNLCAHLATGEFLAHFDDDDLYAPLYLTTMLKNLKASWTLGTKLSSWFTYDRDTDSYYYCAPERIEREKHGDADLLLPLSGLEEPERVQREACKLQWSYGYGFSYVYRRSAALEFPFADINQGEDFDFFWRLMCDKGRHAVLLALDVDGICLHMQHGCNTSCSSCTALRSVPSEEALDLYFADLRNEFSVSLRTHVEPSTATPGPYSGGRQWPKPSANARRICHDVIAHTVDGDFAVFCPRGSTADEFLSHLENKLERSLPYPEVYHLPLADQVPLHKYQAIVERAVRATSPGFPLAEGFPRPGQALSHEEEELFRSLRSPIPGNRTIGTLTKELWVSVGRVDTTVRVKCRGEPPPDSLSRTFHLELPVDARVVDLRHLLSPHHPHAVDIFTAMPGGADAPLLDEDWVPQRVELAGFEVAVTAGMVFTQRLFLECKEFMIQLMRRQDMQDKLDQVERQANGREMVLRVLKSTLYFKELYPAIAQRFGLEVDKSIPHILEGAFATYCQVDDLPYNESQLELETLMRNRTSLEQIRANVTRLRWELGLPVDNQDEADVVTDVSKVDVVALLARARTPYEAW